MRSIRSGRTAGFRLRVLRGTPAVLAGALVFSSCAELDYLQTRVTVQEQRIRELEGSLQQWQDGYNTLYKQNVETTQEFQKQLKLRDQEISRLRTLQSDREERLVQSENELKLQLQREMNTNTGLRAQLRKAQESSGTRIDSLQKELDALKADGTKISTALEAALAEAKQARERADSAEQERQAAREKETAAATEKQQLLAQLEKRDKEINGYKKQIAELQESIKNTATSESQFSEKVEKLQEQLAAERRIAEGERKKQTAEIARLNAELAKLRGSGKASDPTLDTVKGELAKVLAAELKGEGFEVFEGPGRVGVRISSDTLFEPYTVLPREEAKACLGKIAGVLKQHPNYQLRVEGHTDNQPVRNIPLPDNLALSAQRAGNVLRALMDATDLPQKQIRSTGCSDWIPLAKNDTPEGRKRNRRVEIILTHEE